MGVSKGSFSKVYLGVIALASICGLLFIVCAVTGMAPQELCASIMGSEFMPHGHCYFWDPTLLGMHVASDSLIGLSYFSIPVGLVLFARKRPEASFRGLMILFGAFICLCGITHALAVYNVWIGAYWISGFAKVATAGVSLTTAFVLLRSLPQALSIPLPQEYRKVSRQLESETLVRADVERRLLSRTADQTKELWESDSRWRLLSEFIYSAVWMTDRFGQATQPMPGWEKFTGQDWETYKGFGWLEAYHEGDRERLKAEWERCLAEGANYQIEARLWCAATKDYLPVLIKGIPWKDGEGTIHEWLGAVYDLSEVKMQALMLGQYSRRLKMKNEYLQEFAYAASHDLREPLRKIVAYGGILEEDFGEHLPDEGRDCIKVMQNAANRMGSLIDGLLTFSRISTGELSTQRISLDEMVGTVLEDLEVAIGDNEGRVTYENLGDVEADPVQLRSLMQNLIGNALKYCSPGRKPEVQVLTRQVDGNFIPFPEPTLMDNQYLEIQVVDNGIGFDSEDAESIFKPFHRLHPRGTYSGSGMGLAICKRIIDRHNGQITVSSRKDKGSRFKVYLPMDRKGKE